MEFETMQPDYTFTKPDGSTVPCYGDYDEFQNIDIACENENYDGIWCGDDGFTGPYTWHKVCKYLLENYRQDIVQLVAV